MEQSSYGKYVSCFEYGYDLRRAPSIRYPSPHTFERLIPSIVADVMTSFKKQEIYLIFVFEYILHSSACLAKLLL
jgi:hypothetical protein